MHHHGPHNPQALPLATHLAGTRGGLAEPPRSYRPPRSSRSPGRPSRRHLLASAGTTLASLAALGGLGACAPSGGANGSGGTAAVAVSTDIASLPEQTLTVWDQETRGGQDQQMEQLNAAFMRKYPNITIDRVSQSFDDLQTTLRLALSGDDAPDVVQANNARSTMGQLVSAGQILSLDPWAQAYGWRDSYSSSVLTYSSYSADGTTFGEGSLYGLPQVGEVVGIYYSRERLKKLGLSAPGTWEELGRQLATIKKAGQVPLMLGNAEKWPALHVFGPVQGAHVDAQTVRALGFGNAGASWDTPENLAAATEIHQWARNGYFNEGFNGTDNDTAWESFSTGEGAYLIGGSWLAADLQDAMGDDVVFTLPPQAEGMSQPQTTGGTGLPFTITSAAQDPNVAAAYIAFITSSEAMQVLADTGNVPVNHTADYAEAASGVTADVMTSFDTLSSSGQVLPYLDYATPTFDEVIGDALQSLLDSRTTPQEFLDTLQAAYSEFTGQSTGQSTGQATRQ